MDMVKYNYGGESMEKEKICIAYCGEAVDRGIMDVNDLAPALLAFGELVHECNKIANKDSAKVNVYVSSQFQQGSFEISIEILQSLADQIKGLFTTETTYSIKEMLNVLGFASNVAGVTGLNLLEVIRWVRNRKVDSISRASKDLYRIHIKDEYKEISALGMELFRSVKIRKSIEGVISPLNQEGIGAFEVREKEGAYQHIGEAEKDYYKLPDEEIKQDVVESTRRCFVKVCSISFEQELKWRFRIDTMKFYAAIRDPYFINRVAASEISFAKGVSMLVDLHEIQTMVSGGNIKTEYEITKVHKIVGHSEQLSFDFT